MATECHPTAESYLNKIKYKLRNKKKGFTETVFVFKPWSQKDMKTIFMFHFIMDSPV